MALGGTSGGYAEWDARDARGDGMMLQAGSFAQKIWNVLRSPLKSWLVQWPASLKGKRIEMPPQAQSMLFNESLGMPRNGGGPSRCDEPGVTAF